MAWFKRTDKGIQTPTESKKDTPKGLWYKSPTGKVIDTEELEKNFYVSPEDGYHVRIGSNEYFKILFDDNKFEELDPNVSSKDPLKFEDSKKYKDRLVAAQEKTKLKDAIRTAVGKSKGKDLVIACMDLVLLVVPWGALLVKNCPCCSICPGTQDPIYYYFEVWWGAYDGGCIISNAIAQDLSNAGKTG